MQIRHFTACAVIFVGTWEHNQAKVTEHEQKPNLKGRTI